MKILWGIYVIIGLGAFAISYLLESLVFFKISGIFFTSYALAAVFESAKIMTIIMHHFQTGKNKKKIPLFFQGQIVIFRLTLFIVSIYCSVALLATFLDKPNLNKIMLADKKLIESNYQENKKSLHTEFDKTLTDLGDEIERKYQNRYSKLGAYYEPRIEKEEKLRDFEFNNIINNIRKGPKWHEHDRKINIFTNDYQIKQDELQIAQDKELISRKKEIEGVFFLQLNNLRSKRENCLIDLEKRLNNDPRVCNQMLQSLITTMKKGLNFNIKYDFLIALFAIIIAFLLELTLYIVFKDIVTRHQEIFSIRHKQYLETEIMHANAKAEMDKDNINNEVFKNRVQNQFKNLKDNVLNFKKKNDIA